MAVTEPQTEPAAKAEKMVATPQKVVLRDISKGIFFYPLALYSLVAAIAEHFGEQALAVPGSGPAEFANTLSLIWVVLFFANVFVVSFDFSTGKFLILILVVAVVGLVIFLLIQSGTIALPSGGGSFAFNLDIRTHFYWMMAIILLAIVGLTILAGRFRYVKIEANEVLVKGILGDVKRFPTANLHYDKKIVDVFEYLALRAGTIILHISGASEPVELYTVINVHKKAEQMDALLSAMKVSR
jgi:hypothetical protein